MAKRQMPGAKKTTGSRTNKKSSAKKVNKTKNTLATALVRKSKTDKPRIKSEVPAADRKPIPKSLAECDEADKQLYEMKQAGETWDKIRATWEQITGEKVKGTSSLPNRYNRITVNFCELSEDDQVKMFMAKIKIEDEFSQRKWEMIRKEYLAQGGHNYSATHLQVFFRKMMTADGYAPPSGIRDVDFQ